MKLNQLRNLCSQQLRQLCVALAGQVHEIHLVELAVLCVQEVHALPLADDAELPGYTGRFFYTAIAHHSVVEACADGRRCHHQNVGLLGAPAVHALGFEDQPLHARSDAGGVGTKALLDVICAQHDDKQVDDLMALEQGIDDAEGIHGFVDGVHEHGGAAGKALFRHKIFLAQCLLQAAGPALLFIEADAVVGAVVRVGTVAVGVGITQTENMCFRIQLLLFHGLSEVVHCAHHTGIVVQLSGALPAPLQRQA